MNDNPRIITRTAICPRCNAPALRVFDNPNVKGGIEQGCGECDFHDPPLQTELPKTGILWKLSPEEREVLLEVCAHAHAYLDVFRVPSDDIKRKQINQLLGEEK